MDYFSHLSTIQKILNELEFDSLLLPASETGSMDMILLKFQLENYDEQQSLAISLMPLSDELDGSVFVQFYYEYPFLIPSPFPDGLKNLINNTNRQLPLGHFNTTIAGSQISFKYVLALQKNELVKTDNLSDVLDMVLFAISHFRNEFSRFKN